MYSETLEGDGNVTLNLMMICQYEHYFHVFVDKTQYLVSYSDHQLTDSLM